MHNNRDMRQKMKRTWAAGLLTMCLALGLQATEVKSPNGNIVVTFDVVDGRPVYSMTYKGRDVVRPSHLGLELAKDKHASAGLNEHDLMGDFTLASERTSSFDETWQPVWGETRDIRNHYNEYAATLTQQWQSRTIVIRFRVYDDGIGFRYEFPQQKGLNYFLIKEERTEFAMAGDHGVVAARRLRHAGAGDAGEPSVGDS